MKKKLIIFSSPLGQLLFPNPVGKPKKWCNSQGTTDMNEAVSLTLQFSSFPKSITLFWCHFLHKVAPGSTFCSPFPGMIQALINLYKIGSTMALLKRPMPLSSLCLLNIAKIISFLKFLFCPDTFSGNSDSVTGFNCPLLFLHRSTCSSSFFLCSYQAFHSGSLMLSAPHHAHSIRKLSKSIGLGVRKSGSWSTPVNYLWKVGSVIQLSWTSNQIWTQIWYC